MRVLDAPYPDHTLWKKTGIILLQFFNAYPVADAFGTGHNGDNGFLFPLMPRFYHCVGVKILVSQEFGAIWDGMGDCPRISMIHQETRFFQVL